MHVIVLGSGAIVRGYDQDFQSMGQCRSLLKGLSDLGKRHIVIVDPFFDESEALPLSYFESLSVYENLDSIPYHLFDNAYGIIATPDSLHYEQTLQLMEKGVKYIFVEKPLALSGVDANALVDKANQYKALLFVNYFRKYLPSFQLLKRELLEGRYGVIKTVTASYGKGLLHNGSHMIDLVHYLVGKIQPEKVFQVVEDFSPTDPSVGFVGKVLVGESTIPIVVYVVDSQDFTHFELELITSCGKLQISDLGRSIHFFASEEDMNLKGYKVLKLINSEKTEYMYSARYSLQSFFGMADNHSGHEALMTILTCDQIRALI